MTEWKTGIVLSDGNGSFLLKRKDETWRFPSISLPYEKSPTEVSFVQEEVRQLFGKELRVALRAQIGIHLEEGCAVPSYMWLESVGDVLCASDESKLFSLDELQNIDDGRIDANERDKVLKMLRASEKGVSEEPFWRSKGWISKHVNAVKNIACRHNVTLDEDVNQLTSNLTGTVLKFWQSDCAGIFVKTCSPLFSEVSMSVAISKLVPDLAPGPFAVDSFSNAMLMKNYGRILGDLPEEVAAAHYTDVLQSIGTLHKRSLNHIDALRDAGFPQLTFDILKDRLEEIIQDPEVQSTFLEYVKYATDQEVAHVNLSDMLRAVEETCAKLDSYNIPMTVLHGDLATSNILIGDEEHKGIRFYDWEYGCISHPFVEVAHFLHEVTDVGTKALSTGIDVGNYLKLWEEHESMDRIVEALALAEPLAELTILSHKCCLLKTLKSTEHRREVIVSMCFNLFFTWIKTR